MGSALGRRTHKERARKHTTFSKDYDDKGKEKLCSRADGTATVYKVQNKYDKCEYAVKKIRKELLTVEEIDQVRLQISIMQELAHHRHPNIVQFQEAYESKTRFYIITELIVGADLLDSIQAQSTYTEKEARDITRDLLLAIKLMHAHQVIHGSIKPENLMTTQNGSKLKVIGFGSATHTGGVSAAHKHISKYYVAPEILKGEEHGIAVDMWAVGVITYILLAGYAPFDDDDPIILFEKIKTCDYEFNEEYWDTVSESAKDLIRCLLQLNPSDRLTAEDALQHPWINAPALVLSQRHLERAHSEMSTPRAKRTFRQVSTAIIGANRLRRLSQTREENVDDKSSQSTALDDKEREKATESEDESQPHPPAQGHGRGKGEGQGEGQGHGRSASEDKHVQFSFSDNLPISP